MANLIISVSGIRGVVGISLTPAVALRFAQCYGTPLAGQAVAVSRDGRPSGLMLKEAVAAGLLSVGCRVVDLGIQPTPTVGVAVRALAVAGGIQITASHNPSEWNGLKLFAPEGAVLGAAMGSHIADRFRENRFVLQPWDGVGRVIESADHAQELHLQAIQKVLAPGWDGQQPFPLADGPRFKVLVDANHGSGGRLAAALLRALGHQPVVLGEEPTGLFAHKPEPSEANLRDIAPKVKELGCDFGCALDPDADRLALIDETGRYLGEEATLALAARQRLAEQKGPVVINLSTSRMTEDVITQAGGRCVRVPVGEANVVAGMLEEAAVLGGEGNGGVIDPRVGWVRDPFIGLALLLRLMQGTGQKLSALAAALPRYEIVKDKLAVDADFSVERLKRLESVWEQADIDYRDGLRFDLPEGWLHARPSNTEPIVRLIAEAKSTALAEQLIAQAKAALQKN